MLSIDEVLRRKPYSTHGNRGIHTVHLHFMQSIENELEKLFHTGIKNEMK